MHKDEIIVLPILNWTAPSLVPANMERVGASLLGALVNGHGLDRGTCLGACFMPCHAYQKGQLWLSEKQASQMLANSRCNCDHSFALPFQSRADERDQR